ncbi:MAG TPA: branched-chain amino acid ABC transporter substrate-binding protein, partial [Methylibium sp.]
MGLALCGLAATAPAAPTAAQPIRLALIEGLSGPFGNAGEAVWRNLAWAVERVNARGGVQLPGGARPLQLLRYDSKGDVGEALSLLKAATDDGAAVVLQGNSSAVAAALIDAVNKRNEREPDRRVLFFNYAAVDPALTNENCSFWHFRFDANADMRLAALSDALRDDAAVKKVYLIGQDYSFGRYVLKQGRALIAAKRPDVEVVGEELHPIGRIKDFLPYAAKIKASGADAVLTGNWGNDLTLLIKAAREAGVDAKFYTFYGNALGAPAAIGEAGVGRVLAVAEWHPNVGTPGSDRFYQSFRQRFPRPEDDYVHARMQAMIELLAQATEKAHSTDAVAVARALEGLRL